MAFAVGSSLASSTDPADLLAEYRNYFYLCIACIGLAESVGLVFLKQVDRTAGVKDDSDGEGGQTQRVEAENQSVPSTS